MEMQIRGVGQLTDVSRALKGADKALTRELLRGFQKATKEVRADMRENARTDLPHGGGLNEVVAASTFSTRTTRSGRNPGVRIVVTGTKQVGGRKRHDTRSIDRGRLRHPVYGNRKVWVTQLVTPGVFTTPFLRNAPEVRRELLRVMEDVVQKIARSAE